MLSLFKAGAAHHRKDPRVRVRVRVRVRTLAMADQNHSKHVNSMTLFINKQGHTVTRPHYVFFVYPVPAYYVRNEKLQQIKH